MPRQTFEAEVIRSPQVTAVVASAKRLTMRSGSDKKPKTDTGWQRRCWYFYDVLSEYRFACSWVGNILSRALLVVHEDGMETKNEDALAAIASLFGGQEGQTEMLRELGTQFTVAGEAYLIGEDGGDGPDDKWWVVAATEISGSGGVWKVGKKEISDPLVIRLWRPHPREHNNADSPSRAVLPVLGEIEGVSKHINATINSRLAGAGLLLMPDNITFATTQSQEKDEDGNPIQSLDGSLDNFLIELMQTMMIAIENREDPAALVPIFLQAAGEHLDKIRHLTFSTPFDKQAVELRKDAIRRLGLGMDMPPEILTGTGEVNHWGAWQIEEAAIKSHTEPLLHIITTSLTEGYLRPYLEDQGMSPEDARRFTIHADTSKMRLRPNRSKEALELWDRGILSEDATARENGFDIADLMSDEDRRAWLLRKVAGGSTTPEQVAEALILLGVNFTMPTPQNSVEVQEGRPTRSLLEHPTQGPPPADRTREEVSAGIAEAIVIRALERAGARIKSKYGDRMSIGSDRVAAHDLYRFSQKFEPEEVDDLLLGAWSIMAAMPACTESPEVLDQYVRMLLATNTPHYHEQFMRFLKNPGVLH